MGTVTAWDVASQRPQRRGLAAVRPVVFLAVTCLVVAGLFLTVLQPVVRSAVVGWASDNPSALGIGFVADFVKQDLGSALTDPNSTDATKVEFTVDTGDTAVTVASRLHDQGLLRDPRALVLIAVERGLTIQAGPHSLARNMTPDQIAAALVQPAVDPSIILNLRSGLRLEQITALIAAKPAELAGLNMDPQAFYNLVTHPPAGLLKDYPWLVIPKGGTLEGYLAAGSYKVLPDTTPDKLVRMMLDNFAAEVGADRMKVVASRGLTWYQVLTLASIVEEEDAKHPDERALIAGVFQNRLDEPTAETAGFLGSDVTVFYVNDTIQLAKLKPAQFGTYFFWSPPKTALPTTLPATLAGYNTYTSKGLPPGPICTPTVSSIDAALKPDTKAGYLYFLGRGDKPTVFAKTAADHQKNIQRYGTGG